MASGFYLKGNVTAVGELFEEASRLGRPGNFLVVHLLITFIQYNVTKLRIWITIISAKVVKKLFFLFIKRANIPCKPRQGKLKMHPFYAPLYCCC